MATLVLYTPESGDFSRLILESLVSGEATEIAMTDAALALFRIERSAAFDSFDEGCDEVAGINEELDTGRLYGVPFSQLFTQNEALEAVITTRHDTYVINAPFWDASDETCDCGRCCDDCVDNIDAAGSFTMNE